MTAGDYGEVPGESSVFVFFENKVASLCNPYTAAFVLASFLSESTAASSGKETEI